MKTSSSMLRFIDLLRLVCKKTSNYREINRIIQVDSPRSIVFFGNEEEEEEEEEEKKGSNLTKTMVSVTKNFTMHYTSMDVQTIYKRLYELLKRLVFIEHDIYYTVVVNQHKYNRYSDYLMASYTNNADLLVVLCSTCNEASISDSRVYDTISKTIRSISDRIKTRNVRLNKEMSFLNGELSCGYAENPCSIRSSFQLELLISDC